MVDPFLRNGSTGGEDEKNSLKGKGHSSGDTGRLLKAALPIWTSPMNR